MTQQTYAVSGMSCARAVTAVAAAIAALPGVEDVKVRLAMGQVDVRGPEQPTLADLRAGRGLPGRLRADGSRAMNNPVLRLAGYALVLVVVFAAAFGLGTAVGA